MPPQPAESSAVAEAARRAAAARRTVSYPVYNSLSPYGTWIDVAGWGVPAADRGRRQPGRWRPYL